MDHQQKLQLCRISLVVLVFALFTGDLSVAVVVEIVDFKVSNKIKSPFRSMDSSSLHSPWPDLLELSQGLVIFTRPVPPPWNRQRRPCVDPPISTSPNLNPNSTDVYAAARTRGPPQPTIWKRDPNIQTQGCQSTASCSPAPARFCCESDVESSLERLICS